MTVLKFKIYTVKVDNKDKTNDEILDIADKKFKKQKEKAMTDESPMYLLPEKDMEEAIAELQHKEAQLFVNKLVTNKYLN